MLVLDANVVIDAFRDDAARHERANGWLTAISGTTPFTVPDICFAALIRITTNPRTYARPSAIDAVLAFANEVRSRPAFRALQPGPGHWALFGQYCRLPGVVGNDVTDAYLAALAAERNDELITFDRGFARFPGLRWRDPSV